MQDNKARAANPAAVQLTRILQDWSGGDQTALERLTPIVYGEMYRIARARLADEREGHVLQPSALVNETFIRLLATEPVDWTSRAHFYAHAARLMRRILIDIARERDAHKRDGGRRLHLPSLDRVADERTTSSVDFLDLDAALSELAALHQRQAQVVELRYFGGLEMAEIAEVLGVALNTVSRDWRMARAWLFDRLRPPSANPLTQHD